MTNQHLVLARLFFISPLYYGLKEQQRRSWMLFLLTRI